VLRVEDTEEGVMAKYVPTRPCIVHRCPRYAVPGGSRCPEHGGKRSPSSQVTLTAAHRRARAALVARLPLDCWICGKPILTADDLNADHVNHVSMGGSDDQVAPAHARCNLTRGARW